MAKWTKEQRNQTKEKVKSILIRKPSVSQYELARVLEINKITALKLKKEIIAENTSNVSEQKVEEEIGKMEAEYEQLALECWEIITKDFRKLKRIKDGVEIEEEIAISPRDKVLAIKTIMEGKKNLFNIKFDAGLFKRKLGELEFGSLTEEQNNLIKKAIELDYGKKPEPKPEPEPEPAADSTAGAGEPEPKPETAGN